MTVCVVLFTREGCELCEQAAGLYQQLEPEGQPLPPLVYADIAADAWLTQRYDWSIPVLYRCEYTPKSADGHVIPGDLASVAGALRRELVEQAHDGLKDGAKVGAEPVDAGRQQRLASELYWPFPLSRLRAFLLA